MWEPIRKRAHTQFAEPQWTGPGLKSGISVRELISTLKKKRRRGMNCRTFAQKPRTRGKSHLCFHLSLYSIRYLFVCVFVCVIFSLFPPTSFSLRSFVCFCLHLLIPRVQCSARSGFVPDREKEQVELFAVYMGLDFLLFCCYLPQPGDCPILHANNIPLCKINK